MNAVTAGSENNVNSVYVSDAATSRRVVNSPRRGGTASIHWSLIECFILADRQWILDDVGRLTLALQAQLWENPACALTGLFLT